MTIVDRDIQFYAGLAEAARTDLKNCEPDRESYWIAREAAYLAAVASLKAVKAIENA